MKLNVKIHLLDEIKNERKHVVFNYAELFSGYAKMLIETQFENYVVTGKSFWTGLQDKNGKDIYEGDILKCRANIVTNKKEIKDYDNHGDIFNYGLDPQCEIKYYNNEVQWYEGHHHGYRLKNGRFTLPINQSILLTMEAEITGNVHEK